MRVSLRHIDRPGATRRLRRWSPVAAAAAIVLGACSITPTAAPAPAPRGGHHGPYIDGASIPGRGDAVGSALVVPQTYGAVSDPWVGAFRTECRFSHAAYDDPIVYPGQPGASHLHAFYGNAGMDAYSSTADNGAPSTCAGGTANRSGYWVPPVIDSRNGAAIVSDYLQIYYKTGYAGVAPSSVQSPPAGLRIVAGQSMGASSPDPTGHTYFYCNSNGAHVPSIPTCPAGDTMIMAVVFPQCWDGRNLDSPDHRSHMAYPTAPNGCPASHPVPLPEIIQHAWYPVPASGTASWRLASDMYDGGPGGYSAHADWWNGWDRGVLDRLTRNCWNGRLDCRMNLLGDGAMLGFFD